MPNLETIQKLYDFGGLLVYEVIVFDEISFSVKIDKRTFSEKEAKEVFNILKNRGYKVQVNSYFVRFDGAYSE